MPKQKFRMKSKQSTVVKHRGRQKNNMGPDAEA